MDPPTVEMILILIFTLYAGGVPPTKIKPTTLQTIRKYTKPITKTFEYVPTKLFSAGKSTYKVVDRFSRQQFDRFRTLDSKVKDFLSERKGLESSLRDTIHKDTRDKLNNIDSFGQQRELLKKEVSVMETKLADAKEAAKGASPAEKLNAESRVEILKSEVGAKNQELAKLEAKNPTTKENLEAFNLGLAESGLKNTQVNPETFKVETLKNDGTVLKVNFFGEKPINAPGLRKLIKKEIQRGELTPKGMEARLKDISTTGKLPDKYTPEYIGKQMKIANHKVTGKHLAWAAVIISLSSVAIFLAAYFENQENKNEKKARNEIKDAQDKNTTRTDTNNGGDGKGRTQ